MTHACSFKSNGTVSRYCKSTSCKLCLFSMLEWGQSQNIMFFLSHYLKDIVLHLRYYFPYSENLCESVCLLWCNNASVLSKAASVLCTNTRPLNSFPVCSFNHKSTSLHSIVFVGSFWESMERRVISVKTPCSSTIVAYPFCPFVLKECFRSCTWRYKLPSILCPQSYDEMVATDCGPVANYGCICRCLDVTSLTSASILFNGSWDGKLDVLVWGYMFDDCLELS